MKTTKALIEELTILLEIANDGKERYEDAAKNTEVPELELLFTKYAKERASYVIELKEKIESLRCASNNQQSDHLQEFDQSNHLQEFDHSWLNIKGTLYSKKTKAILDTVISLEQSAIVTYDQVLKNEPYNTDLYDLLSTERFGIQKALNILQTFSLEYEY